MSASLPRFRLTATTVAGHFKYRCDRRFRWTAVPRPARGRAGTIGQGVLPSPDQTVRPGIRELMDGGEAFELNEVETLAADHGPTFVWGGRAYDPAKQREGVAVLPFDALLSVLRAPGGTRFIAQPELGYGDRHPDGSHRRLTPEMQAVNARLSDAFCLRFGLDPARVELGLSRPDLIELVDGTDDDPRPRLRVWDFKASREPRNEHFVQVAWYTLLLETLLDVTGIDAVRVDVETGAVRTHRRVRGPGGTMERAAPEFDVTPYRRAVERFLRVQGPALLALAPEAAHWHVQAGCLSCEYFAPCRAAADATADVSRVPFLTSDARRALVAEGIGTQGALADLADRMGRGESAALAMSERLAGQGHDLGVHLHAYAAAAQALDDAARVEDVFAREHGRAPRRYESDRRVAEAGVGVWLGRPSLLMPSAERVRIVIAAEQDAVSHRCYALGFRLFRWNAETGAQPEEWVRVSSIGPSDAHPDGDEGDLLDAFLVALFQHLNAFDAHNRAVDSEATDERRRLDAARTAWRSAKAAHTAAVAAAKADPKNKPLDADKKAAYAAEQAARAAMKEAKQAWDLRCRPHRVSVQLYVYDALDLRILREAVERHLFRDDTPGDRYERLRNIARLAPPTSLLPDPGALKTLPFTVVQTVLRQSVALPVPYLYDLKTVSARLRPRAGDGEITGRVFSPAYGFHWELSNQLAFERIHDVWKGETFEHTDEHSPLGPDLRPDGTVREGVTVVQEGTRRVKRYTPDAVREGISEALSQKLAATDSVVRALRARLTERAMDGRMLTPQEVAQRRAEPWSVRTLLPFPKPPFYLARLFDPLPPVDAHTDRLLESLATFTVLEEATSELDLKQAHTQRPADRAARFEALDGLVFRHAELRRGGTATAADLERCLATGVSLPQVTALVFDAPASAIDSKRSPDDLSLLLTNADDPAQLIAEEDGELFRSTQTPFGSRRKVSILSVRAVAGGVEVRVKAGNLKGLVETVDLSSPCVIDEAYADFNSEKTLGALTRLRGGRAGDGADHVRALVAHGTVPGHRPALGDGPRAYAALETCAGRAGLLNDGQRRALEGALAEPLSLVWGPPGTGKTHTVAHTLLALALSAQHEARPLRVLVTAQSHHAIANVLRAVAKRAAEYGIDGVRLSKIVSSYGVGAADRGLTGVDLVTDGGSGGDASVKGLDSIRELLPRLEHGSGIEIVGATVWATHKMTETWRTAAALAEADAIRAAAEAIALDRLGSQLASEADAARRAVSGDGAPGAVPPLPTPGEVRERFAALSDEERAWFALEGDSLAVSDPATRTVAPLFDVVLIDEASQLKLADALLPLLALRTGGHVILAGDDRQLPPIVRGTYPEDTAPFLTSVFAFMRHRLAARMHAAGTAATAEGRDAEAAAQREADRTLCLLDENFRMNHPLTEYPRRAIYGCYRATQPGRRIVLSAPHLPDALLDALLDPERPLVLVRYAAPRAYTARNPLEADLAARIVAALAERLCTADGQPYAGRAHGPDGLSGHALATEGVAVIAPHRAQNATIRERLRRLGYGIPVRDAATGSLCLPDDATRVMPLVDTVDKAQGQEFDAVVVSYGVADAAYAEAEAAFLLSEARFNVAVTRARAKAIVLVSDAVLSVVPADRAVLLGAAMLHGLPDYCCHGDDTFDVVTDDGPVTLRVSWRGFDVAP